MIRKTLISLLFGVAACAQEASLDRGGSLTVQYAGVKVLTGDSLLLMDANWKNLDGARPEPKITRRDGVTEARYESALTTLTKTLTTGPTGVEVRWDIVMKPDPRGASVELCVAIPAAVLADLKPTGKTHDVLRSQEELRVSSVLGEFTFDVRGSSAPWSVDDMRSLEWSKAFRLRFAPDYDPATGLRATAVLRVKATPTVSLAFACLDVGGVGNRGLRDDVAADGQGGWTDQGDNDLRLFAPGRHAFAGVPVEVGERVVVLQGKERPAFPADSGSIAAADAKFARLYFLHTTAWSGQYREPIAEYVVTYADGQPVRVPVRYGVDISDWWGAGEALDARLAWSGNNGNGSATVGLSLMRWQNPKPDVPIRSLQMHSLNLGAVPVLLGVTGLVAGQLLPEQIELLDAAFADRGEAVVSTQDWIPAPIAWCDGIEPGSALDVSFLNDGPAGKYGFLGVRDGHFVFEKGDGKPVRFWGTNAALYGPFPTKDDAPGIARCLARQGVNMVRLHLYAVYEDTMIAKDGSLNPDSLDRFEFFIAQLKENGIYSYMDLNDGMFYDRLVGRALPVGNDKLKMVSLFSRELIEAQKRLARQLFTHLNPYTSLRLCDDPAIAVYEITNENSMTMGWGSLAERVPEPYYTELRGLWRDWLKTAGKPDRDLPETLGDRGSDEDSRRFAAELQRRYLEEMRGFLRELGVKGPLCGTNITFTLGDLWASESMDYTNDHAYWDHPNVSARPMTYSSRPSVTAPAWTCHMLPTFARAKIRGKPVSASEWNYCFPNDYRCEGLPIMAAYAAYQDWDSLLFYCATGSFDAGRWARFHDSPGILIHSQQTDPATWGLSQVSALLFRRGDVSAGRRVVTLCHDPESIWANRSPLGRMPFLCALARLETVLVDKPVDAWPMSVAKSADPGAKPADIYAAALRELGDTRSTETRTVSDTGELTRDAADGILTVDTPCTQMAAGALAKRDEIGLANLSIRCETRFSTIAIASLDGKPIETSQRLLLTAVANARNADSKLEGGRIESMGKGPVLAEPVTAKLALRVDRPDAVRVQALDTLTGKRVIPVTVEVRDKALCFAIGPECKAIYYEIYREGNAAPERSRTGPFRGMMRLFRRGAGR